MFWRLIALALALGLFARADVDPCKRQPFRGRCPSVNGAPLMRSQFVLRYYLRESECVSYPYGHCANDENEPKLFRYKEECEDACTKKASDEIKDNVIESQETPAALEVDSEVTETITEAAEVTAEQTYGTASAPVDSTTDSGYELPKTECQRQQDSRGQGLIKGGFVPECTKNGEFKQLQCEQDKSECFCVNSEGIEIDNSRTKGEKPDCGQIIVATSQRTNDCVGKSEFGPCKNQIPRWFYDESSQICQQFVYSGCGGSGNNYPTEAACQKRCVPTKEAGKCHHGVEPLKTAQGRTVNCAKTDCPPGYKCSVIQQNSVCCPDIEKMPNLGNLVIANACDQPKERGPCDRYELRFYFNKELKECKYFFFGGCEGNDNNFARVEDCEKICGAVKSNHDLPPTEPTTIPSTTIRTTPKPTSPTTEHSKISLGPRIHLPVEIELQTLPPPTTPDLPIDRCLHPKDGGNCGGQFVRWLWNNNQRKCEPFTYTGCGGNGNNFATQEECLSICHIEVVKPELVPDVVNVCDAEVEIGECTGSFMRYAFDRTKSDCRQFQYGGCGGNGNNFATLNDCRRKCIPSKGPEIPLLQPTTTASTVLNTSLVVTPSLNVCTHPIEIGECSGVFQRFAYDGDTNECRSFEYGGCGGNGNNFATLEECRSACIRVRCPQTPSCDTSRCQIVGDNRGCPFCSCPPPAIHPPLVPSIETRPQCPFLDVNMCVEPCIIFRNRHGCEECVCPVMPSQLPPRVLPTVPQPPPRPFSQPSPEVDLPPPSRPAPPAPSRAPSPPSPPSPPGFQRAHVSSIDSTRITRPPLPGVPIVTVAPLPVPVAPSHQIGLGEKCTQPVDPGPCKNFVERWHFNDQRGECEPFHYGGCAGNRNHFFSRRECEIHCARFSRVSHSHVEEPVQPQPIFESRPPPPPSTFGVPVIQTRPPQVIETRSPTPSPNLETRPPFVPVFETRPPPIRFETRPSLSPPTRPPLQSTVTISKEIEPSLSRQPVFSSTFAPSLPSQLFSLPAQQPIHTISFPPTFRPSTVWSTFAPAPIQNASQPSELIPSSTASVIQTSQRPSKISSFQTQIPVENRPASGTFPPIAPPKPVQPLRIPILPQQPAVLSTLPPFLSFSTISTHIFNPITFAALPSPQPPVEKPVSLQPIAQQPHFRQLPPQLPPKFLPNQSNKQFAQPIFDKTAFDKQSSVSDYQPSNSPIQPENINNQYIPPQPPVVPGITPAPIHPIVPDPTDLWPANVVKPKGGSYGMEEIKNTGQGLIKIQSLPKPTNTPVFETVTEATTELVTEAPKTDALTVSATEATTITETQPSSTETVTIATSTAVPVSSSEASLVTTASVVASTLSNTVPDSSLPHSGSGYGEEPAAGYGSATLPKESVEEIKPSIEDKVPSTKIDQKNLSINNEVVITPKPQLSGTGEYRVFGEKSNIQTPIDPPDELQPEQMTTIRAAVPTQTSAKIVPPTTTIAVPQPTQPTSVFTPRPLAPRPTTEVFGPPQLPRTFENEICVLPPDSGNCTSYIPRFFYNSERGICQEFSYGSCGGNANNFLDKFSCEAKCGLPAIVAALPLRCQMPKQEGFGQGYFPKWYFNVKNLRCERLVYKGNNGNENQFESQQNCEQICQTKQIAPTAPPRETFPPRNPNKPEKKPLGSVLGVPNAAATNGAFEELPAAPMPYEPVVLPPATSAPQPPAEAPAPAPNPEAPAPVSGTNALEPLSSNSPSSSGSNYDARPAEEQMIPHPDMKLPSLGPSPPGGIDYSSGRSKASGLPNRPVGDKDSEGVIDPNEGQPILLPPDDGLVSIVEEEKPEKDERSHIPLCPNEQDALRYENNETVMCLPGKNNCPENSVCYFNGMDFYCCPNAEDPYDMHVFGGYDGEEEKHGYKSVPTHLNIRSLRARRQASLPLTAFSIDHITKPLRFDDKPITQISRAGNIDRLAHLRVNPCTQIVDKGECREAHLRFFYDIKVDSCRLFYYSGCGGNANNFATQKECENRCKLGIVITTTTQEPQVPPGRCPGGKIPLGENAPVLCGNQTDSIDCPSGYYCRQGPPDVCCPDEPFNLQTILAASSNREIRRKPFINAAGKFDGGHDHHHHHEEHAHAQAHGVATEHGPEGSYNSENADVAANAESIDASPVAETQQSATETHSEVASVAKSASGTKSASSSSSAASTPNPISIPLPENMCPDGSDALVEGDGKVKICGAGFDGHTFCPKGYYCSIDLERNSRLCCPMIIQGSNIPPPPVDAPYFGHRRSNPGEVVERGSLPSDPKPPKLSTPKPKMKFNSGDIENNGSTQTESESVAQFENAGISGGNVETGGSQQVAPAAIPESGHEKPYAHLMMKPVDPPSKLRKMMQIAVNSTRGIDEGHIRLSSVEDPFELDEKSRPRSKSILDKSICQFKPTEGRVCREDESSPKTNLQYYYSVIDKKCKLFFHHGCGGNLNRFDSKTACERFCIVQQQMTS